LSLDGDIQERGDDPDCVSLSLLVQGERARELRSEVVSLPKLDLTAHQVWDLELLLNGAFTPLTGFLDEANYRAVCERMRLADGSLWPLPINLGVTEIVAASLRPGARLVLRHPEGMALAVMTVGDIWRPDKIAEAEAVFGTSNHDHPGVSRILHDNAQMYVGGRLDGLELPPHHTFPHLRHTPDYLRAAFARLGWERVVAFQTRNPVHSAHMEMIRRAAALHEAHVLLHPVVGRTSPGDVDYFSRVRCYQAALRAFPPGLALLSLLPLAMRMGGPREALWHAIIRRNYGATHFIVGRNHAGPRDANGESFYDDCEARDLTVRYANEVGICIVPFEELVYVENRREYVAVSELPEGARALSLSGTELRRRLQQGIEIPTWFSPPEVIRELRRSYPPPSNQGYTVFFTGLSGAGKSTIANILVAKLTEIDDRPVTLLDGDIVRKHLSSELGFSRSHRDLNVQRIGFVASEITKSGGVAICALIAPYRGTRRLVRELISRYGGFIEVHIATPLEVCERRDPKGLYARARAGIIKQFTGIDDPYETPETAEIVVDTSGTSAGEAAQAVVLFLQNEGYFADRAERVAP
jgi:sulfate adenylyltransferase